MLRKAVFLTPNNSLAHYQLGNALLNRGDRREARQEWQKVLKLPDVIWSKHAQEQLDKYLE
jgi:Flp pilus assembly protein TadD